MKKGDIKKGLNGEIYILAKRIGRGGQAEVWKAQSKASKNIMRIRSINTTHTISGPILKI